MTRRHSRSVLQFAAGLLATGVAAAGLFAAIRNDDEATPGAAQAAPARSPAASAVLSGTPADATPSPEPSPEPATVTAEPTPTVAAEGATAAPPTSTAPASAGATQAPAPPPPPPTPTPTTAAPAQAGLPRFRDTEVLARAANAVVPSGKTFRECVEAPPSTEHWPTPVHLYYEGNGRWLVETHLSEVQVVFNEATETFTPRNFAPPNPGCL